MTLMLHISQFFTSYEWSVCNSTQSAALTLKCLAVCCCVLLPLCGLSIPPWHIRVFVFCLDTVISRLWPTYLLSRPCGYTHLPDTALLCGHTHQLQWHREQVTSILGVESKLYERITHLADWGEWVRWGDSYLCCPHEIEVKRQQ